MFKRKKKKTGCETPEYRRSILPPNPNLGWQPTKSSGTKPPKPPTSGSNAQKPPNTESSAQPKKKPCPYITPCGYCTKWDKKCDKKIGPEVMPVLKMPDHVAENIIEDVKNRMYESCGVS